MKNIEKLKAIKLRKEGFSIKEISRKLIVAKSSVSLWVRNVELTQKQLQKLTENGQRKEVVEKRRQTRLSRESFRRLEIMKIAAKKIKKISKSDLRLIGLCLYLGEGSKTQRGAAKISSCDPDIIKIMMRYFKEVCLVDDKKFRGHIHTYSHLNVKDAERYWSSVSGIPKKQFYKTYSKPSIASKGKKDSTPYGTLDLTVCSTELFLQIMGQIEKIKKLLC